MIYYKSAREIALMRAGGHILAEVLERLRTTVKAGMSTLEIDEDVEAFIIARGAKPAFKGYRGFPATVCISINEEVVHGIPSARRRLKHGDVVGFDQGSDRMGPIDIAALASKKLDAAPVVDPNAVPAETSGGKEIRLVVFGDSDFASNEYFRMAGNRDLLMNTVAWLNEKSDLISIRPKAQAPQPIVLTGVQANMLTLYTLAVPLCAAVAGVVVTLRRRRL